MSVNIQDLEERQNFKYHSINKHSEIAKLGKIIILSVHITVLINVIPHIELPGFRFLAILSSSHKISRADPENQLTIFIKNYFEIINHNIYLLRAYKRLNLLSTAFLIFDSVFKKL